MGARQSTRTTDTGAGLGETPTKVCKNYLYSALLCVTYRLLLLLLHNTKPT